MNDITQNEKLTIGIVGGMGSYATLSVFDRILDKFPANKEWDRPRVIIDNRCTMPSRVRAILYGERTEELIDSLEQSIEGVIRLGGGDERVKVLLACNTSHYFLPEIYKHNPKIKNSVVHLIEECALYCSQNKIDNVYLIATEGTIESRIYDDYFGEHGINIEYPSKSDYIEMRRFIELVKQNKFNYENDKEFIEYLKKIGKPNIILGCTEFSAIWVGMENQRELINEIMVIDPIEVALNSIYNLWKEKVLNENMNTNDQAIKKKVLTVGVFDYFHLGHLRLFKQAKKYGNYLEVAVQDEKYISKTKPEANVLYTTEERIEFIESLKIVDEVIVYEDVDRIIKEVDFDVFAVGEDQNHPGFKRAIEWCEEHGKEVVYLSRTQGISSRQIKLKV